VPDIIITSFDHSEFRFTVTDLLIYVLIYKFAFTYLRTRAVSLELTEI